MISEKKEPIRTIAFALGVLVIVLAFVTILMAVNVIPTVNSNRAARLVNVGMGGFDNSNQRILHISGYVCNVGLDTAYHAQVRVKGVYTAGGEAMNTLVDIPPGTIFGGDSLRVEADVQYSAPGLGSWTITPVWSYTP